MERAISNARHPRCGCRAALFVSSLIIACSIASGETACDQVPEARRAQCLKVMSCMAVEDDDVRRACIDSAQRQPEERPQEQEVQPQEEQKPRQLPPEKEPKHERAPEAQRQPPQLEETVERQQRQRRQEPASRQAPPDEFSGTVSRVYQSILDRQLIAVDAKYLFASDRAAHARLAEGEHVEVEKVSSRFFGTGSRWRIIGSSRTSIVAFRIRCEIQGIRSDDRRKCVQMLDR